jgi:hypothetical protein
VLTSSGATFVHANLPEKTADFLEVECLRMARRRLCCEDLEAVKNWSDTAAWKRAEIGSSWRYSDMTPAPLAMRRGRQ